MLLQSNSDSKLGMPVNYTISSRFCGLTFSFNGHLHGDHPPPRQKLQMRDVGNDRGIARGGPALASHKKNPKRGVRSAPGAQDSSRRSGGLRGGRLM